MSQRETREGAQPEAPECGCTAGTGAAQSAPGENNAENGVWRSRFDEKQAGEAGESKPEKGKTGDKAAPHEIPLPKVDFSTFALSLASSALVQLGEVPNPETGQQEENLALAQHTIDILAMVQEKIRNGLSEEEGRLLEGVLYELRMKYVIKSR